MSAAGWRTGLVVLLVVGAGAGVAWYAFGPSAPSPLPKEENDLPVPETALRFEDVTAQAGIEFDHFDSNTPKHYIPETMGSGLAWIDYDNDGWLDLFCVQVRPLRPGGSSGPPPTCRLYRNKGGTFADVTDATGAGLSCYGMGVAVGDFDNDGFDDLFVTALDEVFLLHNRPDGKGGRRFADVTAAMKLSNPHWGTSCGWGDIDNDGFLDLYVCNYCEIDLKNYAGCVHPEHGEYVCPPRVFPMTAHRLFRNVGGRSFADISVSSGVAAAPPAPGLGVVLLDLDDDGRLDIYAANDMMPAYLFHNRGGGKFTEEGVLSGCALQANGRYLAGMGVAVGDFDGSGRPSLFVTNYQAEPNNLFLNRGKLSFTDGTHSSGLGPPSKPFLGFGAVLFDGNLDGLPDVAVANGHVLRNARLIDGVPYEQTAQLFEGAGDCRFRDVSRGAGPYFRRKLVGRGLAWADYDNDGRPDLAFSHNGGPLVLLRNTTKTDNRWLRLQLVGDGVRSNRNAIGARVEVEAASKRQVHFIAGGGSYLSESDRRLLIGMGGADRAERIVVTWPSGRKQEVRDLATNAAYRIDEGKPPARLPSK